MNLKSPMRNKQHLLLVVALLCALPASALDLVDRFRIPEFRREHGRPVYVASLAPFAAALPLFEVTFKGPSGASPITIGTTPVVGGATTQVFYNLAGLATTSADYTYNPATFTLANTRTVNTETVTYLQTTAGGVTLTLRNQATNDGTAIFGNNGAGQGQLISNTTFGLALGTTAAGPVIFGTNNLIRGFVLTNGDLRFDRHIGSAGTAPVVSLCGTTPSTVTGNDQHGRLTTGSGGTVQSCTLTFAAAYAVAPVCDVNNETTILLIRPVPTTTTLVIDSAVAGTLASQVITYSCRGL